MHPDLEGFHPAILAALPLAKLLAGGKREHVAAGGGREDTGVTGCPSSIPESVVPVRGGGWEAPPSPPPRHYWAPWLEQLITQPQPPWISDAWACLWDWIQRRWNVIQVAEACVEGAAEIKALLEYIGDMGQ